jgi:hypothetical protein
MYKKASISLFKTKHKTLQQFEILPHTKMTKKLILFYAKCHPIKSQIF